MDIPLDQLVFSFFADDNDDDSPGYTEHITGLVDHPVHGTIASLTGYSIIRHIPSYTIELFNAALRRNSKVLRLDIAAALFDMHGVLRACYKEGFRRGTGCWGDELNTGKLIYVETIEVDASYRRQGVGSLLLAKLAASELVSAPSDNIVCRPSTSYLNRNASSTFLRKNGFRRIGRSPIFGYATNPSHPSHHIAISNDAPDLRDTYPPAPPRQLIFGQPAPEPERYYLLHEVIRRYKTHDIYKYVRGAYLMDPASIRERDEDGFRPMHVAAVCTNRLALEALIELGAGADLQAYDNADGTTPLEALQEVILAIQEDTHGLMPNTYRPFPSAQLSMEYILKKAMGLETGCNSLEEYVAIARSKYLS